MGRGLKMGTENYELYKFNAKNIQAMYFLVKPITVEKSWVIPIDHAGAQFLGTYNRVKITFDCTTVGDCSCDIYRKWTLDFNNQRKQFDNLELTKVTDSTVLKLVVDFIELGDEKTILAKKEFLKNHLKF